MSKFNIIKKLKDNFQENLNDFKNMFKESKSALINFDNYMSNSPKLVIGLSTAGIIAVGALGYDTFKHEFEDKVSLDMYQPSVADVKLRTNQMTSEFLRVPAESATIKNIKYSDETYSLNNATGEFIKLSQPDSPHIYKNPFWTNNIITVYNQPNEESHYQPENLNNAAIDISNHIIYMDYNQINNIGRQLGVTEENQYLLDSYALYHEAAHASYSQSIPYSGQLTNSIENELKSDISALVMIGHERKADFDYLIDKVIQFRISNLSAYGDMEGYSHNATYGLIELKKAVNTNPIILDMAPENISQFSDMFVKELKSVNLSQHHEKSLKDIYFKSSQDIRKEINDNKNASMYSSIYFHQVLDGQEPNKYNRIKLPSLKDAFTNQKDLQIISEAIEDKLKNDLRQESLTSVILQNSKSPTEAIQKLTDMATTKPALKNDFITAIARGNLIYIDELKVNIEPVKKIEEEVKKENLRKLEQQNENNLKRKVQLQKPSMNNNTKT